MSELLLERFDPADFLKMDDDWTNPDEQKRQAVETRALKTRTRHELRRANPEAVLAEVLPAPLDLGATYHVISGGDVGSLSFLGRVLAEAPMDYVLLSTWRMAMPDVEQVEKWLTEGRIGRMDAYGGEIFPSQYPSVHRRFSDVLRAHGGRMAIFRNHAKVFAGTGPAFAFAIESSAT